MHKWICEKDIDGDWCLMSTGTDELRWKTFAMIDGNDPEAEYMVKRICDEHNKWLDPKYIYHDDYMDNLSNRNE